MPRFKKIISASVFILCLMCLASLQTVQAAPPGNAADWTMTFDDEFDGTTLDRTKWESTYPTGARTNNGMEYNVDEAVTVSGGTLKITAKKESVQGRSYTSGVITSVSSFSQMYGYFEARMKLPSGGAGLWPAFWMMALPLMWPPEIDIMENLGQDTHVIYFTNHWTTNYPNVGGGHGGQAGGSAADAIDYSAGFHTYAVLWDSTQIVWYLDGAQRARVTDHVPLAGYGFTGMYVLLNFAVGGDWPGAPTSSTVFPSQMEIDYVRIYQKRASSDTTPPAGPSGLRVR